MLPKTRASLNIIRVNSLLIESDGSQHKPPHFRIPYLRQVSFQYTKSKEKVRQSVHTVSEYLYRA